MSRAMSNAIEQLLTWEGYRADMIACGFSVEQAENTANFILENELYLQEGLNALGIDKRQMVEQVAEDKGLSVDEHLAHMRLVLGTQYGTQMQGLAESRLIELLCVMYMRFAMKV